MELIKYYLKQYDFYLKWKFSRDEAKRLAIIDTKFYKELNDPRNYHLWAEAEAKHYSNRAG